MTTPALVGEAMGQLVAYFEILLAILTIREIIRLFESPKSKEELEATEGAMEEKKETEEVKREEKEKKEEEKKKLKLIKELEKLDISGLRYTEELVVVTKKMVGFLEDIKKYLTNKDFVRKDEKVKQLIEALTMIARLEGGLTNIVKEHEKIATEIANLIRITEKEKMRVINTIRRLPQNVMSPQDKQAILARTKELEQLVMIELNIDTKEVSKLSQNIGKELSQLKKFVGELIKQVNASASLIKMSEYEQAKGVLEKAISSLRNIMESFKRLESINVDIEKLEEKEIKLELTEDKIVEIINDLAPRIIAP